jgi:tetratricopeptide (TPR) repeat protein
MEGTGNFRDAKSAAAQSDARRIIRYTISVAAAILLVVIAVIGYNFYSLSANKIFIEQYSPYKLPGAGENRSYRDVENLYSQKKFDTIVEMARLSSDTLTLFLAGTSSMEMKNYTRAIRYFKRVTDLNEKAGTRNLKDETEYYLALDYIIEKDFDLSLELLHKIYNDKDHRYNQKVKRKLLKQLKWLKWR